MSYESAVALVIVFSIPTGFWAITRFIRVRQQEKTEQAEQDLMFSEHKHDSNGISVYKA